MSFGGQVTSARIVGGEGWEAGWRRCCSLCRLLDTLPDEGVRLVPAPNYLIIQVLIQEQYLGGTGRSGAM